ncbi:flagellar biosynthesis protein FlhB [Granulosicoccaceae sp. 1_MG-2023]|nr:flagellar biosynthesis protein FlhB [Granulosicoccaceae sp. 1_MG-2023]
MAENDSGQDKTEDPSEKRLRDAREKGQIPRSRELNTVVMLFASVAGFAAFGGVMSHDISAIISQNLTLDRRQVFDKSAVTEALAVNTMAVLEMLAPFFLLMFIAVFIGPLVMGGLSFSMKALAPKMSKLNPGAGFKRMFGLQGLVELIKALFKFSLIGGVAVLLLSSMTERFVRLGQGDLESALAEGMWLMTLVFVVLCSSLLLIVIFDVPYQKWTHTKKLRMTRQEVKEEHKEANGNPQLKSRIRQVQMQMANRRMLSSVPDADVVIVNPTHYSVALAYGPDGGSAPRVLAKGVDHMALKIREIAAEHKVPVFEAPPLARALYYHTDVDQEIPEGLYLAVARVLAYIFRMRDEARGTAPPMDKPVDLPVPEDLRRDD